MEPVQYTLVFPFDLKGEKVLHTYIHSYIITIFKTSTIVTYIHYNNLGKETQKQ